MDEFDNMTEFSPFTWQPVYADEPGDMIDFNISIEQQSQLSSSRGILETIVEETSDDEDNHFSGKWSPEEGSYSSGTANSETGSVVRVDMAQDQDNDTISERDFICPPKRRKQEKETDTIKFDILAATSTLFNQNLAAIPGNPIEEKSRCSNDNSVYENYFLKPIDLRYRFEELGVELFSDSDRLSFTSLSRSSSLIQFESLERQMLSDNQISGSSPSIYSQLSLEANEKASALPTSSNQVSSSVAEINVKNTQPVPIVDTTKDSSGNTNNSNNYTANKYNNSDSEPYSSSVDSSHSGSSNYSSDESESNIETKKQSIADSSLSSTGSSVGEKKAVVPNCLAGKCGENRKRCLSFKNKNSVDSLSEDSGYCDHIGIHRRSPGAVVGGLPLTPLSPDTSITTGNYLEDEDDNVIEEKSILRNKNDHLLLEQKRKRLYEHFDSELLDDDICYHSMENLNRTNCNRFSSNSNPEMDLIKHINVDSSLDYYSNNNYNNINQKLRNSTVENSTVKLKLEKTIKLSEKHEAQLKNEHFKNKLNSCEKENNNNGTSSSNSSSNSNRKKINSRRKIHAIHSSSTPELFELSKQALTSSTEQLEQQQQLALKVNPQKINRLVKRNYKNSEDHSVFDFIKDICCVSSVPDYINLLSVRLKDTPPAIVHDSVASKDFNLYNLNGNLSNNTINKPKVIDIGASCANLTLLDYSEEIVYYDNHKLTIPSAKNNNNNMKSGNSKRNADAKMMNGENQIVKKFSASTNSVSSDEDEENYIEKAVKSKELTSLLDEISAHFDRNLSILNDREPSVEPQCKNFVTGEKDKLLSQCNYFEPNEERDSGPQSSYFEAPSRIEVTDFDAPCTKQEVKCVKTPPAPPPRRCQIKTSPNYQKHKLTFDRDPTNLTTTYAESLERCTFNVDEPINVYDSKQNLYPLTATLQIPDCDAILITDGDQNAEIDGKQMYKKKVRRNLVSSTPNLSYFEVTPISDQNQKMNEQKLSTFVPDDRSTSMKEIPTLTGILAAHSSQGSKNGLVKGVSFCPIVSEISWRENVDYEEHDEEQAEEVDATFRNDSLVNYYHDDFSSEEDEIEHKSVPQIAAEEKEIKEEKQQQPKQQLPQQLEQQSHKQLERVANKKKETETENVSKMGNLSGDKKSSAAVGRDSIDLKKMKNSDKKTFFSRLSSGFRFSFRKSKKNKNPNNGVTCYPINNTESANNLNNNNNNNNSVNKKDQEFVYIPLKDPKSEDQVDNTVQIREPLQDNSQTNDFSPKPQPNNNENHVLIGKPPLPKMPPRIVGVCAKNGIRKAGAAAHVPIRASSTPPREIDAQRNNSKFSGYSATMSDNHKQYYGAQQSNNMGSEHKIGLIETNLDTDETIINGKTQSLMELGIGGTNPLAQSNNRNVVNGSARNQLMNRLTGMGAVQVMTQSNKDIDNERGRPHKSMEFLLDKENQQQVLPPENELQKSSTAALSEHQLRVQASLQKLNIPDWYKQYSGTGNTSYYKGADGTSLLKKRNSDVGRWQGLNSKTTSLSSLGSNRSDRSPVLLSPSAHSHHGQTGFSRWSTSHLNSNQTSPSVSTRSSFVRNTNYNSSGHSATIGGYPSSSQQGAVRSSFRQPYMGWRSQEKLSQPRTPHERLASSLLAQKQEEEQKQKELEQPMATQEIQSSIKEVTSAIVHYVNDQNRSSRSRSVSPSTRCWLESSFVGTKPLESPQTPIIDNSFTQPQPKSINIGPMSASATNYDSIRLNGVAPQTSSQTVLPPTYSYFERSNSDTTLEDVLSSLLGLPTDSHSHRSSEDLANQQIYRGPSAQSTTKTSASFSADPNKKSPTSLTVEIPSQLRRLSEGDVQKRKQEQQDPTPQQQSNPRSGTANTSTTPSSQQPTQQTQHTNRRVSLDSSETNSRSELIKCRYPKCEATATPIDAKKTFKSCHNCNFSYCSRDCRRNHWEKHRRACLHSRVSAICRQVLSSCKDDPDTLRHLSLLARRGFLMQGRGVVRVLFRSPENADMFIKQGFQCLGEVSYVRWPDLMPAEMGPELYSELLRLSTEYKTDSKMLVYVAICVVSEAPGTATAPVKWERQLVSRCAKLKLCKSILTDKTLFNTSSSSPTSSVLVKQEFNTDVLILTFNATDKFTQKSREIIMTNVLQILHQKGINLRKHYPEVFQRLNSYVEGLSDRFLPVTIHPRDNITGKPFVCIIMPVSGESEKIKLPPKQDGGDHVQTIDVGIENLCMMEDDINSDIFTEGTKF